MESLERPHPLAKAEVLVLSTELIDMVSMLVASISNALARLSTAALTTTCHSLVTTLDFSTTLLQNCNSLYSVLDLIPSLRISLGNAYDNDFPLHFFVCDKTGQSAVLEASDNGMIKAYNSSDIRVVTNYPSYDRQLENLKNYSSCSPVTKEGSCYQGTGARDPMNISCSGGEYCLPGDFTSPSRFVRAHFFVSNTPTSPNAHEAIQRAFAILASFDIPYGSVLSHDRKYAEVTQYTDVYDLSRQKQVYAPHGFTMPKGSKIWVGASTPVLLCNNDDIKKNPYFVTLVTHWLLSLPFS